MARRYAGEATRSRPCAPCCAVWLLVGSWSAPLSRAATERATRASKVPPTDLSPLALHGTRQSATTWRKAARVSGGA